MKFLSFATSSFSPRAENTNAWIPSRTGEIPCPICGVEQGNCVGSDVPWCSYHVERIEALAMVRARLASRGFKVD